MGDHLLELLGSVRGLHRRVEASAVADQRAQVVLLASSIHPTTPRVQGHADADQLLDVLRAAIGLGPRFAPAAGIRTGDLAGTSAGSEFWRRRVG